MSTATIERTKMKLRPLADRILVERDDREEMTSGGIMLPDSAREKVNRGRVVAVGPGKLDSKGNRIAIDVQPGDHILFGKYAGDEISVSGDDETDYLLVKADDVLAVIDES